VQFDDARAAQVVDRAAADELAAVAAPPQPSDSRGVADRSR
jgi:hypothetical protein